MAEAKKNWRANKTNLISVRELRLEMPKIIREVGRGKSFLVIKRSRPVFKIGPVSGKWI